jgi:serine/threonine protein phosphatase PrpC
VARVNGQLAVSRAFGDKNLKTHLRSDPDIQYADVNQDTEFLILASDGLWKVFNRSRFSSIISYSKMFNNSSIFFINNNLVLIISFISGNGESRSR